MSCCHVILLSCFYYQSGWSPHEALANILERYHIMAGFFCDGVVSYCWLLLYSSTAYIAVFLCTCLILSTIILEIHKHDNIFFMSDITFILPHIQEATLDAPHTCWANQLSGQRAVQMSLKPSVKSMKEKLFLGPLDNRMGHPLIPHF